MAKSYWTRSVWGGYVHRLTGDTISRQPSGGVGGPWVRTYRRDGHTVRYGTLADAKRGG